MERAFRSGDARYALVLLATLGSTCRRPSPVRGGDAAAKDAAVLDLPPPGDAATSTGDHDAERLAETCPGEKYSLFGDIDVGRWPSTLNTYPECPEGEPEGRMRIERVRYRAYPSNPGHFETLLDVVSLDLAQFCLTELTIKLKSEVLDFRAGSIILLGQRTFVRNPDADVTRTWVFRNDAGTLLFAFVGWTRPEVFDRDVLAGIDIKADLQPCSDGGKPIWPTLHVLSEGGADCVVSSYTKRCCTLWNAP